jgi:hypothetical protein
VGIAVDERASGELLFPTCSRRKFFKEPCEVSKEEETLEQAEGWKDLKGCDEPGVVVIIGG